jgi:hypothetical protein
VTSDSVTETPGEDTPAQPARARRVGRDLSAAIGVGVGFGAYVVVCLLFFKPGFVLLIALATWFAARELHQAFQTMKRVEARHIEIKRPAGDSYVNVTIHPVRDVPTLMVGLFGG